MRTDLTPALGLNVSAKSKLVFQQVVRRLQRAIGPPLRDCPGLVADMHAGRWLLQIVNCLLWSRADSPKVIRGAPRVPAPVHVGCYNWTGHPLAQAMGDTHLPQRLVHQPFRCRQTLLQRLRHRLSIGSARPFHPIWRAKSRSIRQSLPEIDHLSVMVTRNKERVTRLGICAPAINLPRGKICHQPTHRQVPGRPPVLGKRKVHLGQWNLVHGMYCLRKSRRIVGRNML